MTKKLVRNHSHWGAFLAEVEDGRVVGVRPFERDPDPSPLIEAIPAAVHSQTRIAQPFAARGLAQGRTGAWRGPWPRAVRAGVVGARARSRRRRAFAREARSRPRRDHGRLARLGLGGNFPRTARAVAPLYGTLRRLHRSGFQLQFWHRAGVPAARLRQRAGLHRAAHLVVVDRAPRQADGDVRRRQSEEHAGDQRRHGRARHRPVACGARRRRRRGRQCQPDPRGWPGRGGAGMDRDQARHRYRDAARADAIH